MLFARAIQSRRVDVPLSGWYPVKAIAIAAATGAVVASRWRDHHPFPRFGPGNHITTVRALLVALIAAAIGEPASATLAAGVVAASGVVTVLDGVDGSVARRTKMASAFGARYDMEVDALLILALAILVWQFGKAGAWVIASGLLRYAFVAAGWVWERMRRPLTPTRRARIVCVVQIGALMIALLPGVTPPASAIVSAAGLGALAYSFAVDTVRLWRGSGGDTELSETQRR
jgi:phosphatidylglycerophosphate synthase